MKSIHTRRRKLYLVAAGALTVVMATSTLGRAKPPTSGWQGEPKPELLERVRNDIPADRYEMAGGCYAVRDGAGGYLVRDGDGFAATGTDRSTAEAFHLRATDLGSYLLFATDETFVSASEGALGEAVYGVTRSQPGQMAGGIAHERTDAAADEIARSEANRASGRGAEVVAADKATELADWAIDQVGPGTFSLVLPATDQGLSSEGGEVALVERGGETPFTFELTEGRCAEFPEIEVNVEGAPLGGKTEFQEVRGYFDAHLHMMAYEFLGGRARCGRPWHRFGVAHALVDCEDHKPGGHGALLEQVLTNRPPGTPHNTDGWPTFAGWPTHYSLTHEQVYYRWLERAWRGGLRMFTNLLVDNNKLCEVYPYKRNSCNEMDGVRLQHKRIFELQDYIDAQHGGPGKGWFRIVKDPFEARRVINEGKLAVVLGIEVSVPLDCGLRLDDPQCDESQIDERLEFVYEELDVRQMELVNKFDNALAGVAGDAGNTGVVVNSGNFLETGRFWQMDTCEDVTQHEHGDHWHEGEAHDKTQHNFHDASGAPDEFSGRDALAGGVLALAGTSGAAPVYPEGPHCNQRGLSALGEAMIRGMVERGMIFDPDHMSALAQEQAMDLIDSLGHSGVVSSHGWSNPVIYQRVYETGGIVTPYAGGSAGFVDKWRQHRQWADPRFYFGFGYGADTNGFGSQGGPRSNAAENPVSYPFSGLGGVTVHQQQSGTRAPYDINVDGVAHYGLYPDWIEDLRRQAGDEIVEDLARGAEAYLQMWERATGIRPDACRFDVADLTDEQMAAVTRGMTAEQVVRTVGQPATRTASAFEYCMTEQRLATVRFGPDGTVQNWHAKRIR